MYRVQNVGDQECGPRCRVSSMHCPTQTSGYPMEPPLPAGSRQRPRSLPQPSPSCPPRPGPWVVLTPLLPPSSQASRMSCQCELTAIPQPAQVGKRVGLESGLRRGRKENKIHRIIKESNYTETQLSKY